MAIIIFFSNSFLLYFFNSLDNNWYSFLIFESNGIKNNKIEFLSICLKNLIPRPLPSAAPSIIPGMSATINDL